MSWRSVWLDWLDWLSPLFLRYMVAPGRKLKHHLHAPIKRKRKPAEKSRPVAAKAPDVMSRDAPAIEAMAVLVPAVIQPDPAPVLYRPQPCEVCGTALPLTTHRTHDGHWRCVAHKGVTCDVCGRALPPVSLPDQAWQCAAHG